MWKKNESHEPDLKGFLFRGGENSDSTERRFMNRKRQEDVISFREHIHVRSKKRSKWRSAGSQRGS